MLTLKSRMTIARVFIRERNLLVFLSINIITPKFAESGIPIMLELRHRLSYYYEFF